MCSATFGRRRATTVPPGDVADSTLIRLVPKANQRKPGGTARATRTLLTQKIVDRLAPGPRAEIWDERVPGFGIRVYATRVVYVLRHKPRGGDRQQHTIGDVSKVKLADARKQAEGLRTKGRLRRAPSVAELIQHYLDHHRSRKKKRLAREDRDVVRRSEIIRDRWGSLRLDEVTHQHVAELHASISAKGSKREKTSKQKTGSPIEANRVRALIRNMWNEARAWGFLPADVPNPCEGTHANRERTRDVRALRPAEVRRLLEAATSYSNPWAGAALHVLAFTGARRSEILRLQWRDVDLDEGTITLRDRKGGDDLVLPLAESAADVLRDLPKVHGSPWVFPSTTKPKVPLNDIRSAWTWALKQAKLPTSTRPHDLRAALATSLAAAGGIKVAQQALGHTDPRTTARYIRPSTDDLRAALQAHAKAVRDDG